MQLLANQGAKKGLLGGKGTPNRFATNQIPGPALGTGMEKPRR
jgi:hypothetical protein